MAPGRYAPIFAVLGVLFSLYGAFDGGAQRAFQRMEYHKLPGVYGLRCCWYLDNKSFVIMFDRFEDKEIGIYLNDESTVSTKLTE